MLIVMEKAEHVRRAGAHIYRGGAFKPRSSPYSFQGLGESGLKILAKVRAVTGMPIVTEVMDEDAFDLVEAYADIIPYTSAYHAVRTGYLRMSSSGVRMVIP
jgi:3-deoxy-7-phosphoheptulonate synthase